MQISCSKADYLAVSVLANNLREADKSEIARGTYQTPISALTAGLRETESYVLRVDDVPVGMFGFAKYSDTTGTMWFLGTDRSVSRDTFRLWLTLAPKFIEYGLSKYGSLFNRVWNGNAAHISWLKRLGAEVTSDNTEFSTFLFRSKSCANL